MLQLLLPTLPSAFPNLPEMRGRKPWSSLNGDRRVESMEGIAAGGLVGASGEGRRGRHGECVGCGREGPLERRKECVGRRSRGKKCGKGRKG